jgi:hypothetical protein
MRKSGKMFCLSVLVGFLILLGGCGGGDDAPIVTGPSATVAVVATINANGTATTGASATTVATPPGTPGYLAAVSATLPANTVITARNADGTQRALTAPISLTFTASSDSSATFAGIVDVPAPSGFLSLISTSGAIDVQLTGAASATFNPAITITMPVPGKAIGAVVDVYTVTGTTYVYLGSFTVTTAGLVSFPVSSLSWKVGDPNPKPNVSTTIATTTVLPTTTTVPTTVSTTMGTTIATTVPTTAPTTVPTTIGTTIATTMLTTVPITVPTTVSTTTTTIPALDGAALYASNCQRCHGPLATPTRRIVNKTVTGIRNAGMDQGLSDAQLLAIIAVLP